VLWLVPGLAFTKYRCEFVTLFCIYAVLYIGRVSYSIYVSMRHYVLTNSGDVVCFQYGSVFVLLIC